MEAAYTSLYLYKAMVEKAEIASTSTRSTPRPTASRFDAPEGTVTIDGDNHHIAKTGLIGQINADNQFDIVWTSEKPIEPDPFLEGYDWWDPSADADRWQAAADQHVLSRGSAPHGRGPRPSPRQESPRMDSFTTPLLTGTADRRDPAHRGARPRADLRPDGRHQHGARRVPHGRRLHRRT